MTGNKMQGVIGKDYTDNSISNFLKYWIHGLNTLSNSYASRDEWRIENDLDVIWLDGDLYADMIFSVWRPLKMCLQCSETYPYNMKGDKYYPYKERRLLIVGIKDG